MEPMTDSSDARRRYWRFVRIMAWIALAGVLLSLAWLYLTGAPFRLHFVLAIALGIAGSVMLAGMLMGLVFFSNRSGHDETVARDEDWNE